MFPESGATRAEPWGARSGRALMLAIPRDYGRYARKGVEFVLIRQGSAGRLTAAVCLA